MTPNKAPKSGPLVDVRIDALAFGGDAVGRQQGGPGDGRATFVPLAAPGETVRVRLIREKARVAWGELDAVISPPSPARVTPPCPLFGVCGGCQWQHVSLEVQRENKRITVARALGLVDVPLRAPSRDGFGYRERARFIVGRNRSSRHVAAGEAALGFRARGSHDVVDVAACFLLSAPLAGLLPSLRAHAMRLPPGSEIDLQGGRDGVHVRLRVSSVVPSRAAAAVWLEKLRGDGVVGVSWIAGDGLATDAGQVDVDVAEEGGTPLRIPAGGFSQVGRTANAMLIEAACEAVGPDPGFVLELHAGSGNFTRHLCARTSVVVASDGDGAARERGQRNVPAARWVSSAIDAGASDRPDCPDTVFVDPPRGGLDALALAWALRARRQIVYVSCDPQTLARDARVLIDRGFRLASAVALDLMPHTFHVEVVARFERTVESSRNSAER